ncbi:GNAT family N-acetyltransferase [Nocardioides salarius]|uniref:GNAT family N-acetyltransferase n=1 Tax=Nocardioides salarius TaxID=374513 RepID=UPI003C6DC1CD
MLSARQACRCRCRARRRVVGPGVRSRCSGRGPSAGSAIVWWGRWWSWRGDVVCRVGRLLGFCGWREHDLGVALGYTFAEPSRGHGYAKEAAAAVVAWGLANIGADRLYASVRPPNQASCKVLEHAGMSLVRECADARGPRLIYAVPDRGHGVDPTRRDGRAVTVALRRRSGWQPACSDRWPGASRS